MRADFLKSTARIPHYNLGRVNFAAAELAQYSCHARVVSGELPGAFLSLELEPVITLGRHADPANLLWNPKHLTQQGVEVQVADRGGDVTAHMPGQLVIYPILPLATLKLGARAYVCILQQAAISVLREYSLDPVTHPERPGVWLQNAKICAIGIRIRQRVSLYGIALNVSNDLGLFEAMIPCGIQGAGVTRLQNHVKVMPTLAEIQAKFLAYFENILHFSVVEGAPNGLLPSLGELRIISP